MYRFKTVLTYAFLIVISLSSIIFPTSACPFPSWTGFLYVPVLLFLCIVFLKQMDKNIGETILKIVTVLWLVLWSIGLGALLCGSTSFYAWFPIGYYVAYPLYLLHTLLVFTNAYSTTDTYAPENRKKWTYKKKKERLGFAIFQAAEHNTIFVPVFMHDVPGATTYALATSVLFAQRILSYHYIDKIVLDISNIARNHILKRFDIPAADYDACLEYVVRLWNSDSYAFESRFIQAVFKKDSFAKEEYQKLFDFLRKWDETVHKRINPFFNHSKKGVA